jgi:hypothetical protein
MKDFFRPTPSAAVVSHAEDKLGMAAGASDPSTETTGDDDDDGGDAEIAKTEPAADTATSAPRAAAATRVTRCFM